MRARSGGSVGGSPGGLEVFCLGLFLGARAGSRPLRCSHHVYARYVSKRDEISFFNKFNDMFPI